MNWNLLCVVFVGFLYIVNGLPPPVYVSNGTHILSYTRGKPDIEVVLGQTGYKIVGLAVDIGQNYLFWSDTSEEYYGIYRSDLTGTNGTIIVKDVGEVNGLSIDWVSRHIYWTDKVRGKLEVANYDGTGRKILVSTDSKSPQAVLADPITGFLFWVNHNPTRIERALLDGSRRRTVYKNGAIWPNQLAVSHKTKLLYWVDAKAHAIFSCQLNGKDVKKEVNYRKIAQRSPGFGLIVYGNTAVVSTWFNTAMYSLLLGSKKLVWQQEAKGLGTRELYSLVSLNRVTQPMTYHPCMDNKAAGCSHLCLPAGRKSQFHCTCPTYGGLAMYADKCTNKPDTKTCRVPCEMLLFTSESTGDVGFISPDTGVAQDIHLISRSTHPSAVTYDPSEKIVYWSDTVEYAIYNARLDSTEKLIFLDSDDGIGVVNSMAFNKRTACLYFTNIGQSVMESTMYHWHRVEMISVHSGDRMTVLQDIETPAAIVVDSEYLYTLDAGRNPRVIRTELDGTDPTVLSSLILISPFGLSLSGNILHVADSEKLANTTRVRFIAYNLKERLGNETEVAWKDTAQGFAAVPNGAYFTDNEQGQIMAFNGSSLYPVLTNTISNSIHYTLTTSNEEEKHDHVSDCITFGCSHGCVPLPRDTEATFRCTCPDGHMLVLDSDGKTCTRPKNFIVYTDVTTINLLSLDEGKSSRPVTLIYRGAQSNLASLNFDPVKDRIYWIDTTSNAIYLSNLHTLEPVLLYKEQGTIDGLVVDSERQRLYWTGTELEDSSDGFIASLNLRSIDTYRKILTGRSRPKALALHPNGKWLFWVESVPGILGAVVKTCKNNGHRFREVISNGVYWPTSLLVTKDKIYIAENSGKIMEADLSGKQLQEVYSTSANMYGLQVLVNAAYYADWQTASIYMVSMDTQDKVAIATNLTQPTSMSLHHPDNISDVCLHGRGSKCTDLCTPLARAQFECRCTGDRLMQEDGHTCEDKTTTTTSTTTTTPTTTTTAQKTTTTSLLDIFPESIDFYERENYESYEEADIDEDYRQIEVTAHPKKQQPEFSSTTHATGTSKHYAEPKPTPSTRKQMIEDRLIPTADSLDKEFRENLDIDEHVHVEPLKRPKFENCPEGETIYTEVPKTGRSVDLNMLPTGYNSAGSVLPLHSNYEMSEHGLIIPWKGKEADSRHHVMFKVTDADMMEATCEFDVVLTDISPPVFTYCPSNIRVATSATSQNVSWDDPKAEDNVGIQMISGNYPSHRHFQTGQSLVNYTAEDFAGNTAFCTFTITVVHDKLCNLPEISHGGIACLHGDKTNGDCSVICETGYVVNPIRTFRRTFNCMHPDDIDALTMLMNTQKPCLSRRYPSVIQQEFRLLFHGPIKKHQEEVISFLSVAISEHLQKKQLCKEGICQIGNLSIPCDLLPGSEVINTNCDDQEKQQFFIKFNVTLMNTTSQELLDMNKLLQEIHLELMSLSSLLQLQLQDHLFMAISDSLSTTDIKWSCPLGQISENNICIACPPGTRHNTSLDICQYCNMGQYQDQEGQTSCHLCDLGQSSPDGATTPSQCHTIPSMDEMTLFVIVTACSFGVVFLCMAITLYLQFQRQQKRNQKTSGQKKTRYNMTPNIYVAPPPIPKSKLDENLSPGVRTYSIDKKHPINIYNNHDYEDPDRSPIAAPMSVFQNEMYNGSPGQVRRATRDYSPMEEVPTGTLSRENTFNNSTYSPLFSIKRTERGSQKGSPIAQRKMSHDSSFSSYSPGMMRTQGTPTSDTPLITQSPLLRLKLAAYNLNHED